MRLHKVSKSAPHVTIIGAGIGGLTVRCGRASGLRVMFVEQARKPGGKLREILDGGAVDSGPTVMTMRWVFDELFGRWALSIEPVRASAGASNIARHAWNETDPGPVSQILNDPPAIGRFAGPAEAQGFVDSARCGTQISQAWTAVYRVLADWRARSVRRALANGITDLLWNIRPYTPYGVPRRYFRDPRLRQLFGRYAGYCGASPFRAPATLMLVAHVEQQGIWYVKGGMYRIVERMTELCATPGSISARQVVDEIRLSGGRAAGLMLGDGESIDVT